MLLNHTLRNFRWLQQLRYRLAEIGHLCAIYFGIAALMLLLSMWLVPSTREQTQQIYASVVDTLRPAGWSRQQPLSTAGDQRAQAGESAAAEVFEVQTAGTTPADGAPVQSAYVDFAQSLEHAAEQVRLAGLSETQYQALQSYIARKYNVAHLAVGALIDIAYQMAAKRQLDPLLILAVIAIESSYNPFAESGVGAQGLMQVMTKVHQEKFAPFMEGTLAVFSPDANIQVGTQILSDCLQRRGSLEGALACYVGATGPGDGGYGKRVFAERSRISLASGIPIQED